MISTEQFAARQMVKPESVLSRLCRTGSYFGIRPVKLANRRLLWPDFDLANGAQPINAANDQAAAS